MRPVIPVILALAMSVTPAAAATLNVFEAGTTTLLGTFDAPAGGGALTSASISVDGGLFDVLDTGSTAPVYDAVNNWVVGAASPFGGVSNSVAYNTTDIASNPITCGVGECIFSLTDSAGMGVPPEWHLDFLPVSGTPAAIDFGFYEIAVQPIPLPATALLLASALTGLASLQRKRTRRCRRA